MSDADKLKLAITELEEARDTLLDNGFTTQSCAVYRIKQALKVLKGGK